MPAEALRKLTAGMAAARSRAARLPALTAALRHGWLRMIGAPDYAAYLARHAREHADAPPLSEREYARMFIERRYGGRGGGCRCC